MMYLGTMSESDISSIVILVFTLGFIMYTLIHLPFISAYHNYRASLIHFTELIILFVTMYYRSFRANSSILETNNILDPILIQLVAIFICILVSIACLIYDIKKAI